METKQLSENDVIVFDELVVFTVRSSNAPDSMFISDFEKDEDCNYSETKIEDLKKQALTLVRENGMFNTYYYGGVVDDRVCKECGSKVRYWNLTPSF